jgi:uncharacterized Zn-binding protein involved in type VI secretion
MSFCCLFTFVAALTLSVGRAQTAPTAPVYGHPATGGCSCPDGRSFSLGKSLFGKGSSRVTITGLTRAFSGPTVCGDLLVAGQIIRQMTDARGRPFLGRQTLKRGRVSSICFTTINFAESRRTYNPFQSDADAFVLPDGESSPPADQSEPPTADAYDADKKPGHKSLEGIDLSSWLSTAKTADGGPGSSPFDEHAKKEGAYVVTKDLVRTIPGASQNAVAAITGHGKARRDEIAIPAGTLGRIKSQAGVRSGFLWLVELWPVGRSASREAILHEDEIAEINEYLDQNGIEVTRYGTGSAEGEAARTSAYAMLPSIYQSRRIPLSENLAAAAQDRMFDHIQKLVVGLTLSARDQAILHQRTTLILDDPDLGKTRYAAPNLLRRQCFLNLASTGAAEHRTTKESEPLLRVAAVDVKIFQPKDLSQVPAEYYAIDLEMQLHASFSEAPMVLVCRLPWAPIGDAASLAQHILSGSFRIQRPGAN